MTRRSLNLASRPFRNERLPAVLFTAATFVLLLVTLQHAFLVYQLWPSRTRGLREEVASLEREIAQLEAEQKDAEARTRVPADRLAEWRVLKDIVDQRTLWWSGLLATLEEVLPGEMRVVSISPRIQKGVITLEVKAKMQNLDVALAWVETLEQRPEFENVVPASMDLEAASGPEVSLNMRYLPQAASRPAPTEPPPGEPLPPVEPAAPESPESALPGGTA